MSPTLWNIQGIVELVRPEQFQICREIIIARRRGSAKLWAKLTKEKL
jgi:hypothetical protein